MLGVVNKKREESDAMNSAALQVRCSCCGPTDTRCQQNHTEQVPVLSNDDIYKSSTSSMSENRCLRVTHASFRSSVRRVPRPDPVPPATDMCTTMPSSESHRSARRRTSSITELPCAPTMDVMVVVVRFVVVAVVVNVVVGGGGGGSGGGLWWWWW
jgi:Flp pilus assembly CpaF family ATPase